MFQDNRIFDQKKIHTIFRVRSFSTFYFREQTVIVAAVRAREADPGGRGV